MNCAIIGLGYVAPKHLKAIKDVGGELIATLDPRVMVAELARRRKLESEGKESSISFEYKHSLNWGGLLKKYYPEKE